MTRRELLVILKKLKIPIVYDHWKPEPDSVPNLPYLVYVKGYSSDLYADNTNYLHKHEFHLDLYQDERKGYDFALEERVRLVLKEHKIPFQMGQPNYLDSEKMYETTFTVTVIEKETQ